MAKITTRVDARTNDPNFIPRSPATEETLERVRLELLKKFLFTATINFATSGNHTIVAADTLNKIKITTIILTVRGETDLTFRRGATNISGPMDFGGVDEPRGMVINHVAFPLETGINEAFVINSSAAVQVSGYVIFYREP